MKVLAISLAPEPQRFEKGLPPKGSQLLRWPNIEIDRIGSIIDPRDQLIYLDEQVAELNLDEPADAVLLYADFFGEPHLVEVASALRRRGRRVICFGPLASTRPDSLRRWADAVVKGDITSIWPQIRADLDLNRLKPCYSAPKRPHYHPLNPEVWSSKPGFFKKFQAIQTVLGCRCPEEMRRFCLQALYYGSRVYKRPIPEVVGEVVSLPFRTVLILDDDIASYPDYSLTLFKWFEGLHHEFVVQASGAIFEHPELLAQLTKAGVRVVYMNGAWLDLRRLIQDSSYLTERKREVQLLHAQRILVGARLMQPSDGLPLDFSRLYQCLYRLELDLLEVYSLPPLEAKPPSSTIPSKSGRFSIKRFFLLPREGSGIQPPTGFLWLKGRFYSLDSIALRSLRSLPKVGMYSMIFYLLRSNLAYRQNFLEGIPYPP